MWARIIHVLEPYEWRYVDELYAYVLYLTQLAEL